MGEAIKRESKEFKRNLKRLGQLILILIGIFLFYTYFLTNPSNEKDWIYGMETLPHIEMNGDKVSIKNVRNFHYTSKEDNNLELNYLNREVNINDLEKAWLVVEPFYIKPFTNFGGVAHTYFVFDFKNSEPIAVSVEARREKRETYDAWVGLLNRFELIYIWGTESDETVRRVISENNPLYMYPLTTSQETAKKLFLQLAQTTKELEKNPRFYNTFTSNCTNELAENVNKIKSGTIPTNRALFLPGYADEELYKLGFIPNNKPLEDIQKQYFISDHVQKYYLEKDFSQKLRAELTK
jgi:hypothetical protein